MAEITTTQSFSDGDTVTATKLNNIQANASVQPEAITNRSAETTVDQANDLLLMYDASATALKKVTPSDLIKAGTASNFPITGNATIGGTLGVTGNSTLGGTLGVTGNASLAGTLGVTGNTSLAGTLGVTGASTLTGNTSVGGTLGVSGAITASTAVINVGSGQIYKDSSGNVGIGITSPINKLTLASNKNISVGVFSHFGSLYSSEGALIGYNAKVDTTSNVSGQVIVANTDSVGYGFIRCGITGAGGSMAFHTTTGPVTAGAVITDSNERMRIDSSGNVGIGVTSPSAKFHVDQENPANGITSIFRNISSSSQTGAQIQITQNGIADWAIGQPAATSAFSVWSGRNGITTGVERLRIDSSGNVLTGGLASSPSQADNNSTSGQVLALNTKRELRWSGTNASIYGGSGGSDDNIYYHSGQSHIFRSNSTERLRIDSSGGVTIAGLAGSGSRAVNASAAGLLSAASDASLKEEVVGAHIAGLDEILQIHPKMYRWKDDIANRGDEASVELGFIANDVAPIIPSAAPLGNDGLYGFYDRSITAALVKAVQELSAKVTALEAA